MELLKNPFLHVEREGRHYYGGNQSWFKNNRLKGCGCGYIACTNMLCHKAEKVGNSIEYDGYMRYADRLKWYLPVLPKLGMNGIFMAVGMNLFFLKNKMPYICFWGMSRRRMDGRISQMLAENTPAVLCIGQNFPNYWGKHKIQLYRKNGDRYEPHSTTNKHFVSVTGMDDEWYRISSWGQELYINRKEFREYLRRHSNSMATNILVVKRTKGGTK